MAVPKLVTATCTPIGNITGQSVPYVCYLPERTQAGNLGLLWVVQNSSGAATVTSVTDDQSQTWTQIDLGAGTGGAGFGGTNVLLWCYKKENTAAGAQAITVNFSANNGFTQSVAIEVFNVPTSAAIGVVWSKEGTTSTTWNNASSQTPTAGNSIYQAAFQGTGTTYLGGGVSTAGTNYALELDSIVEGCVTQSWENVTATSHNPTITVNTTSPYITAALEVKAGASGADGAVFRTKRLQGTNWSAVSTNSFSWHLPTDGNLIVIDSSVGAASVQHISSLTGATFTEHPASPLSNSTTSVQHHHADNAAASRTARNGTVSLSAANTTGGVSWFRDIIGADPSPLDTTPSATGTQSSPGNLQPLTVSPSAGTRLCSVYLDHDSGSETGVTVATDNFLIPYVQQDGSSLNFFTMDSGFATKVISSGTYAPTFTRSATAAGAWAALGASYKAASTAQHRLLRLGVR